MPTFCYQYDFIYEEQVKNNVRELGRALDRPADANALIAKYDQRVRELRAAVIDAGFKDKTAGVIRVRDENTFAVRVGTLESIVYRAVGIPQPAGQQDPTRFQIELTSETLEALNEPLRWWSTPTTTTRAGAEHRSPRRSCATTHSGHG